MGPKNSSATRVQPVFNALLDRHWSDPAFASHWLGTLWALAKGAARMLSAPVDCGPLLEDEAPRDQSRRLGRVHKRLDAHSLYIINTPLPRVESLQEAMERVWLDDDGFKRLEKAVADMGLVVYDRPKRRAPAGAVRPH